MKEIRRLFLALLLPSSLFGQELLDRIAAVVEEQVIPLTQLHQRVEAFLAENRGKPMPPIEQLERQILEQMVLESLQLQFAKKQGIEVSDEELQRALIGIARKNGMELPEFRRALLDQGLSYRAFVDFVRRQLLLTKLHRHLLQNQVEVSEEEVDHFLKTERDRLSGARRYRVGHILLAVPEGASPEEVVRARQKAKRLVEELRGGLDFAQAAMALSQDRYALKGGDLGWRRADQLPTLFAEIVPKLKKGEVYGPIRSPSGFHIIKLLDLEEGPGGEGLELHLRQIVVRTDPITDDEKARELLERLREEALEGKAFAELARLYSEDPSTAPQGGDLGWVKLEELEPEVAEVAAKLAKGEISRPFKSPSGWHLLQLLERRERQPSEEELRRRARDYLARRKGQEALGRFLEKLRQQAHVEILLE